MCGGRGYNHPPTCTCGWFPGLITSRDYFTPHHLLPESEQRAHREATRASRPMVLWYCYTEDGALFVKRMPVVAKRSFPVRLGSWEEWGCVPLPRVEEVRGIAEDYSEPFARNGSVYEFRPCYRVADDCIRYGQPLKYYDIPSDVLDRDGVIYTDLMHPGGYFAKEPPTNFNEYNDCFSVWKKNA